MRLTKELRDTLGLEQIADWSLFAKLGDLYPRRAV
jgi:hypothetical protein